MFKITDIRQPLPKIVLKDPDLIVNNETVAVPGKVLDTNSELIRGHGTYLENGVLFSSVAGITDRVNKLLRVKPVKTRYGGEVGDVVVGRIVEVQANRWLVDINSTQFAVLLLSSVNLPGGELRRKSSEDQLQMTDYLKVGDLVSAEVQRTYGHGFLGLHTRSLKYGKLGQGVLVKMPCSLVKRRKAHFFNLPFGASVILGCNGYVWVSTAKTSSEQANEGGGYVHQTETVGIEARQVIARVANCVKLLARNFIPISDTTITFAYEASVREFKVSALIDSKIADKIATEVLNRCLFKMTQMKPERHVVVSAGDEELVHQLQQYIRKVIAEHQTESPERPLIIGYSGGSMPKVLIPALKNEIDASLRSNVRLFPVDERLVPLDNEDNNTRQYLHGLQNVFTENQFAVIREIEDGEKAAHELAAKLSEWSGKSDSQWPTMDVLFLGAGPDGHTCSLFPDHPLLKESKKWTAPVEDSPKPPPRRITLTIPAVNAAKNVAFIITGEGKANIIKEIIVDKSTNYPTGLIKLEHGRTVNFFLDKGAASKLGNDHPQSTTFTGHL
ncbi:Ribosomal RNA-processing protein 4 [Aphelenchoides besseyi]|nr:Ribosomal RNA-processing protein 4 [Aphelenchoides besseyi]